ncbi:MAG: MFS transporter [Verrucomicrobia bacterium]|nr:MFS transporter [Prolixibacteraceae bacterium]
MKKKPALSFWQIWNMSFGFLGIQFGFALQNANVSRIFETLGANIDDIPILWIAAPVTGLVMQPIIGHLSDKTWGRFGRRRPFFMLGAILASLALLFMPNSPSLWIAAGMLWIMDASINISMEPFRAFVGDMLPAEQRTRGFAMQSFFIGLGAVIASGLPYILNNWLGVENVAEVGEKIPPSVRYSFYLGGAVFLLAVLWTVLKTREYSPQELKEFEEESIQSQGLKQFAYRTPVELLKGFFTQGFTWLIVGSLFSALIYAQDWEKELYIISVGLAIFGVILLITAWNTRQGLTRNGLVEVMSDLMNMPKTMKQLAVVQFFSWFALFAMWIYSTSAVTSHIYGTSDPTTKLYNDGADWVGFLFAIYNGFAALMAFVLPVLARATSRKMAHAIALTIGGIGLMSFYVITNPNLLLISMVGVGIAWASILSMPYAILTGSLPANKMGVYMGIFNFFIVIPQIFAASILGFFTKTLFGGHAIYALVLGGASMVVAAVSVLFVDDIDQR